MVLSTILLKLKHFSKAQRDFHVLVKNRNQINLHSFFALNGLIKIKYSEKSLRFHSCEGNAGGNYCMVPRSLVLSIEP